MRRNILAIGFALAILGNILFALNAYERTRVVSVPDGDTLDLADGRRIRLLGIDAPEKSRCQAQEARAKLVELAQGKHVRLKEIVRDDFGRQLANVLMTGGQLVQYELVSAGFARNESSVSNPYHQVLTEAQEVAKAGKLGVWSDACRGATSGRNDCTIKGNTRAGKKHYYTPDCETYEQVIVDTAFGDRWFCSEEEASRADFARAASCEK